MEEPAFAYQAVRFAYLHFGIFKALVDNNLLPNIISGTSGGGLERPHWHL